MDDKLEEIIKIISQGFSDSEAVKKVLENLTAHEAEVLRERFGSKLSQHSNLDEVKNQFEVTRKRLEDIEKRFNDKNPK